MTSAEQSSGYNTMMRDLEDTIQARDRDSDTNLRELLNTRRKVWELYPRIGALEDSLMRFGAEDSDDIEKLLKEYRGTPTHPAGSAADYYIHGASNPGHHTAAYSSYTPSSARRKTFSSSSYLKERDYDFGKSNPGGYKPRKRVEDKWETQSMVNIPVGKTRYSKTRVPYTQSYRSTSRRRRPSLDEFESSSLRSYRYKGRPTRTDDFETSSVRSYRDDDDGADLEALLRWKNQESGRARSASARKVYDDWSPPRYSPRSPLNAYIYEPDLTTSYQSPRTLVDRHGLGLDDEEENEVILSPYSKVPLTETAVRRHDLEMSYRPYRRYYDDDSSVAGSYTASYNPVSNPHKFETRSYSGEASSFNPVPRYYPRRASNPGLHGTKSYYPTANIHRFETRSYTPESSFKSYRPVTKSTIKYETTSRYKPVTPPPLTTTKTQTRKTTSYQEVPIRKTYRRPVSSIGEYTPVKVRKAKVTFAPPPTPASSSRKKVVSTTRYVDTVDAKPPRYPTRSRYGDRFSDVARAEPRIHKTSEESYASPWYTHEVLRRKARSLKIDEDPTLVPMTVYRETQLQTPTYGGHFRLGIYKGDPAYYKKSESQPAEDITLSHLHNILNAQKRILSECNIKLQV